MKSLSEFILCNENSLSLDKYVNEGLFNFKKKKKENTSSKEVTLTSGESGTLIQTVVTFENVNKINGKVLKDIAEKHEVSIYFNERLKYFKDIKDTEWNEISKKWQAEMKKNKTPIILIDYSSQGENEEGEEYVLMGVLSKN